MAFGASGETLASWYATDPAGAWSTSTIGPLTPPQEGAEIRLGRFAQAGDRLLVGGEWLRPEPLEILSAVLLLSDDRGASWRQVPQPPQLLRTTFDLLLGGDMGFLAYGTDSTANTSGWWDSADGIIWAPATVSGLSSFGPPPWDGAVGPSGTVTVGYRSVGTASVPAAWLSADGHDWELTLEGEAAFGGIQSVAGSALGYAACGSTYADRSGDPAAGVATLWRSADGRSWTAMGLSEEAGTGAACLAMSADGTLVSVYGPFSETGPSAVHHAFIPNGSDQMSPFEMPGISSVVARGSQFVGLLHCREVDPCIGTYILVGTPTEDPQAPGPSLSEP